MKEHTALFNMAMVRALLAGKKTQTRRLHIHIRWHKIQPGDRLWVRETWAAPHEFDGHKPRHIPADASWHYAASEERGGLLWHPSIHMPRVACRLLLEVTENRVEQLHDISHEDAMAEGIEQLPDGRYGLPNGWHITDDPTRSYMRLWDTINNNAETNPKVTVITFKRVTP